MVLKVALGRHRVGGTVALVPLLGLAWGLNWPVVRICLQEIGPWTLRATAFTLATLLLFGLVLARGGSLAVPRRDWGRLAAVGLFSVAGYNMLSAFAQLTASTTRSAVLSYTMPIWAVILARLVLGERLDAPRLRGLLLGVAGLLALGVPILRAGAMSPGLLFAIGSGMSWAIGSTVLKRFPVEAGPLVVTAWQLGLGALVSWGGVGLVEGFAWPASPAASTLVAFAYHVIVGQALATVTWFTILARLPAGVAAIGTLLVPGIGVLGAVLLLGEQPTVFDWTGLVLIVAACASVLLTNR